MPETVWVAIIAVLGTALGFLLKPLGDAIDRRLSAGHRAAEARRAFLIELRNTMAEAATAVGRFATMQANDERLAAELRLSGMIGQIDDAELRQRSTSLLEAMRIPTHSEADWDRRLQATIEAHDAAVARLGELLRES